MLSAKNADTPNHPSLHLALGAHAARRLPHGDELLRGGGVNTDGGVELLLGGAALESDAEALHDLRAVGSDHVAADNLIRGDVHDELHERLLHAARQRNLHGREG